MKFFNTAGPVNKDIHYKVNPLYRWDFEEILSLIDQEKYFILHAPRQTGKTSSLLALRDYLNKGDNYNALYINIESSQAARNNVAEGVLAAIHEMVDRVESDEQKEKLLIIGKTISANKALGSAISYLSSSSDRPLVLLIDEIDALVGDTLISVLRQIRAGYDKRPENFPISIVLCGVRDIKDYRIQTTGQDIITRGSAFNINAESLRLGNFTKVDVKNLLLKHTTETGQIFEDAAIDQIFNETDGQPWLVNAIAYELTSEMKENRDRTVLIRKDMVEIARNRIILSRATHLDQLSDRLNEDRVRRVILPMILNIEATSNSDDDEYCLDLGIIKKTDRGYVIANNIYKEIIPRELSAKRQDTFLTRYAPDWIKDDGTLDTPMLFNLFTTFWRENSEIWGSHIAGYEEAAPQLVFQAFLQRVSNGQGYVFREYGLGRMRTDLMLRWRNSKGDEQRVVIELKILHKKSSLEAVKRKALEQTFEYADKLNSTENHIIIFDRDGKTNWRKKLYSETVEFQGQTFNFWGV